MIRKFIWIVLITFFALTACQAENSPSTETPTLGIINLQVTLGSTHWMDKVAQCSNQIPNLGVYRQILPVNELDLSTSDLILRLGERQETDPYVTVLGTEEIVLVAGQDVLVDALSLETVHAIFTSMITQWDQVPETQEGSFEGTQKITTLSYPSGHELHRLLETSLLNGKSITTNLVVFSTGETLETLLNEHPFAIGYALKSQVPEGVRILNITSDNPQPGLQYVLAITPQEPTGLLRELLLCLQNAP
jgi:predicted secreted protein